MKVIINYSLIINSAYYLLLKDTKKVIQRFIYDETITNTVANIVDILMKDYKNDPTIYEIDILRKQFVITPADKMFNFPIYGYAKYFLPLSKNNEKNIHKIGKNAPEIIDLLLQCKIDNNVDNINYAIVDNRNEVIYTVYNRLLYILFGNLQYINENNLSCDYAEYSMYIDCGNDTLIWITSKLTYKKARKKIGILYNMFKDKIIDCLSYEGSKNYYMTQLKPNLENIIEI